MLEFHLYLDILEKDLDKDINIDNYNFEYSDDEIKILKKISEWPNALI